MLPVVPRHYARRRHSAEGFTLVELLVVIAIMALLTALLLPVAYTLQKQVRRIQCLSALRSAYYAFQAYAGTHNGLWPLVLSDTVNNPTRNFHYWFQSLAPYLDPNQTRVRPYPDLRVQSPGGIKWGCPEWGAEQADAYFFAPFAVGHENGYGMNMVPGWMPSDRVTDDNPLPPNAITATSTHQRLLRQTYWTRYRTGPQRMLLADSAREKIWAGRVVGFQLPPAIGPHEGRASHPVGGMNRIQRNSSLVDLYRHGVRPSFLPGSDYLDPNGGQINYNILYCDGHVETHTHGKEAFRSTRMRFPG